MTGKSSQTPTVRPGGFVHVIIIKGVKSIWKIHGRCSILKIPAVVIDQRWLLPW